MKFPTFDSILVGFHVAIALLCTLKVYLYLAYVPLMMWCCDLMPAIYCYYALYALVIVLSVAAIIVAIRNDALSEAYWYYGSTLLYGVLMVILDAVMYSKIDAWWTIVETTLGGIMDVSSLEDVVDVLGDIMDLGSTGIPPWRLILGLFIASVVVNALSIIGVFVHTRVSIVGACEPARLRDVSLSTLPDPHGGTDGAVTPSYIV